MVEITLDSDTYKCNLVLDRRVTYIRGNSGVGKSTLLDLIRLFNRGGDPSIKVVCDRKIIILEGIESIESLAGYKKTVIIVDDSVSTEISEFGSRVVPYLIENDIYLVLINRVDYDGMLNYSDKSILVCEKEEDGVTHTFRGFVNIGVEKYNRIDRVYD